MTRAKHSALATDVPVYALGFLDDAHVVYAGGGGAGRSGIANAIHCAELGMRGDEPVLRACGELKLRGDEDAPMCLAVNRPAAQLVCGINATEAELRSGQNEEMRVFSYVVGDSASQVAIRSVARTPSLGITDGSHYVRAAAFSPGGDLLAFASTDGRMQLYRWPSREPVWRSSEGVFLRGDEVCDVDFSADGRQVAFTTPSKLVILATSPRQVPGRSPYRVLQTIRDPTIGADQRASLRAAKFGRGSDDGEAAGSQDLLYTLVNAPTSGRSKARESYITAWNADTWEMIATRKVSPRPATVLVVSPDGLLLACASSDLSVTVLQALTLKPVLRVVNTHDFPPTCLAFSPNSRRLVSGSADSTIRVMDVPPALAAGTSRMGTMVYFILCVLLLLVAMYIAHRNQTG